MSDEYLHSLEVEERTQRLEKRRRDSVTRTHLERENCHREVLQLRPGGEGRHHRRHRDYVGGGYGILYISTYVSEGRKGQVLNISVMYL